MERNKNTGSGVRRSWLGGPVIGAGAAVLIGAGTLVTNMVAAGAADVSPADMSTAAANIGWATQSGGTAGGGAATAALTYTVSTRAQLMAAIAGTDSRARTRHSLGNTTSAPKATTWAATTSALKMCAYTASVLMTA